MINIDWLLSDYEVFVPVTEHGTEKLAWAIVFMLLPFSEMADVGCRVLIKIRSS